jgi:hypothetical protein
MTTNWCQSPWGGRTLFTINAVVRAVVNIAAQVAATAVGTNTAHGGTQ